MGDQKPVRALRTTRIRAFDERALQIDEETYGPQHPKIATRLSNLTLLFKDTNRQQEAEPLAVRAAEIMEASLGPDHPDTQLTQDNLAAIRAELAPEASD